MRIPFDSQPHRRYNPLMDEWVLISPHRTQRPWQGQKEAGATEDRPQYDPKCYLCPGNTRAGGEKNPQYEHTYVFTNDYPALLPDVEKGPAVEQALLKAEPVLGTSRVICFSPRHDLTLAEMPREDIVRVIDVWSEQITDLGGTYRWVQLFENRGAAMGASNPHPHGQLWAGDWLPVLPTKENETQKAYFQKNGSPMLVDYAAQERAEGERVVLETKHWVWLVPFWAVWPFEILLLPKRAVQRLPDLSAEERQDLAEILSQGLTRFDNLFETSFPYSMGWHGAPTDDANYSHWQLHAHFYPPLLRSATVRKFMVGYEMLAEAQRDLTSEQAAARLRELSPIHYRAR